jgi:hypothetical protein
MEYDSSEQQLDFLRPVFDEPTVSLWLSGHYAFLLLPADPGRRLLEEYVFQQTVGSQEWR